MLCDVFSTNGIFPYLETKMALELASVRQSREPSKTVMGQIKLRNAEQYAEHLSPNSSTTSHEAIIMNMNNDSNIDNDNGEGESTPHRFSLIRSPWEPETSGEVIAIHPEFVSDPITLESISDPITLYSQSDLNE